MIERAKFPFGFAIPAGHVDEDADYEIAARRELKEEVGLGAKTLELVAEGRKEYPCRREGGTWHYWKIYQATVEGELNRSLDETKQVGWYTKDDVNEMIKKNELDPVIGEWFRELKIVD